MRCTFLPPYSPEHNTIELAFLAIKTNFHHHLPALEHDTTATDEVQVLVVIQESVFSITAQDAHGWFRKCSYG